MADLQCRVQTGADPPAITPCTTFTLFSKLAPELRLKIWKQALPGPRLVEMRSDKQPRTNSHCSTPSILHVCSESRTEALKWYTAFPLTLASDPIRAVYVNFQIDTIYFGPLYFSPPRRRPLFGRWSPPRDDEGDFPWPLSKDGVERVEGWVAELFNNVRFMAMHNNALQNVRYLGQAIPFIQLFGNLEELTVVVHDFGTGDIYDKHELVVCDEWRIGDEVDVSILLDDVEMALLTTECECAGLKNMKVRIALVRRGMPNFHTLPKAGS